MDESGYKTPDTSLFQPCSICGRTFNPDVLARHENVCLKLKQTDQRRKPFDSSKKRAEGTELERFLKENILYNNSDSPKQPPKKKKANWRSKHQQFVNSIRSARVVTKAIITGAPLPPHEPSAPDPDYVQCPYCERRFQEGTAERHIPFCKEKAARLPPTSKAKEVQNKRVAYKPPVITRRHSGAVQDSPANPPGFSVVKKNSNFSPNVVQSDQEEEEKDEVAPPRRKPFRPAKPLARAVQGQLKGSHIPISSSGTLTKKTTAFSMGPTSGDSDNIENQPALDPPQGKATQSMASRKLYAALEYSEGKDMESPPIKSIHSAPDQTHSSNIPPSPTNDSETSNSNRSKPRTRRLSHLNNNGPSDEPQQRDASAGSLGSLSSARRIPLNEHGMPMSKFCYECGTKYPVPQAKYCSECGTKRL